MANISALPRSIAWTNQTRTGRVDKVKVHAGAVASTEQKYPQEFITDLLFDQVGGIELSILSRQDMVDGIDVIYSIIANLSDVHDEFNSNNIITGFENRDTYVNQYPIDINMRLRGVSFDDDGNLVVELNDLSPDEDLEVMVLSDGRIYTV